MKKYLNLLVLCFSCVLNAAINPDAVDPSPEMYLLLNKNYLNAADSREVIERIAASILVNQESKVNTDDLIQAFENMLELPEYKSQYLEVLTGHFDGDSLKNACELIQDERYMKNRSKIERANMECHGLTYKILEEIALSMKAIDLVKSENEIINVFSDNFKEVLNVSSTLILDVYSPSCVPCKGVAKTFSELNDEIGHLYQFAKLNVGENKELGQFLQIKAVPTIIFFKNGKEVGRQRGAVSKQQLLNLIESNLK